MQQAILITLKEKWGKIWLLLCMSLDSFKGCAHIQRGAYPQPPTKIEMRQIFSMKYQFSKFCIKFGPKKGI